MAYLLRDQFTTELAAGAVNATNAEPGPGIRAVADVSGAKVYLEGGYAKIIGTGTNGQSGLWLTPKISRISGRMVKVDFRSDGFNSSYLGVMKAASALAASFDYNGIQIDTSQVGARFNTTAANNNFYGALTVNTGYTVYFVLRNNGRFVFFKDANGIKLRHMDAVDATADLYAGASAFTNNTAKVWLDEIQHYDMYYVVIPVASDSFNRADGLLGSTNGAGHQEANGGSGKAWTSNLGTWGIATNKAASSALDGTENFSVATVDAGSANQYIGCKLTRSAGNVGVVLRYVDADNYVIVYHDGTNAKIDKCVAGTVSTVQSTAIAYAAGGEMRVFFDGTVIRAYYNNTQLLAAGNAIADAALQTGTKFGLYTSDTGNSLDDFYSYNTQGYEDLDEIPVPASGGAGGGGGFKPAYRPAYRGGNRKAFR